MSSKVIPIGGRKNGKSGGGRMGQGVPLHPFTIRLVQPSAVQPAIVTAPEQKGQPIPVKMEDVDTFHCALPRLPCVGEQFVYRTSDEDAPDEEKLTFRVMQICWVLTDKQYTAPFGFVAYCVVDR